MINSFCKLIVKNKKSYPIQINVPTYTFILGRIFKK